MLKWQPPQNATVSSSNRRGSTYFSSRTGAIFCKVLATFKRTFATESSAKPITTGSMSFTTLSGPMTSAKTCNKTKMGKFEKALNFSSNWQKKKKIVNSQAPGFKTDGEVQRNFLASSLIFLVYKNIDHRKLPLIWFLQQPGKSMAEWALFSIEKMCALYLTSFLLSVFL